MKRLIDFLAAGLCEAPGEPSFIRIAGFITVVVLLCVYIYVSILTVFYYREHIPTFYVTTAGLITSTLAVKAYQKGKEVQ